MRFSFQLAILFLFFSGIASAQFRISGVVQDRITQEPLAFVNIISIDGKHGTSTDIEGRFILESKEPVSQIRLSYIGYYTKEYTVDPAVKRPVIEMDKQDIELESVVVLPGINPADTLMDLVIDNRKKNNPEKNCSFSYESYNKLIITIVPDSTWALRAQKENGADTTAQKILSFFDSTYLFLAESVTERMYLLPDKNTEKVLGSRVSGFQNPIFNLLATELQSFTFYKESISLGGIQYEGPLMPNAQRRYFFLIEDTLFTNADTTWVVSFRPKRGKDFNGMKGVMTISSRAYAITSVVAEPAKSLNENALGIKVHQKYELIAGQQWFPVQLNTTLLFNSVAIENMQTIGYANGYLRNIRLNPELDKKDFSYVDLSLDPKAHQKDENFWAKHRQDSLTEREQNTYQIIDSIGREAKLERRTNTLLYLTEGQWPIGMISLDLNRLLAFNDYEGLRAGLGIHTNNRLSKYFSIGGYGAYGFKDKAFKYGGDLIFRLPLKDVDLKIAYQNDLAETGGVEYFGKKAMSLTQDLSELFRDRFDWSEKYELTFGIRFARHFKLYAFGNIQDRTSFMGYGIQTYSVDNQINITRNQYQLFETGAAIRFQFRETFLEVNQHLTSKGSPFPVLWVKYTKGWDGLLTGQVEYNKIDIRLEKRHPIRRAGAIAYRLDLGYIDGESVPFSLMYNPRGTWRPLRDLNVYSGMGFEVMRTNEFLTDKYAAVHLRYDFGTLFSIHKFAPQFSIVNSVLLGDLKQVPDPAQLTVKIPQEGYYESGILINSIIKSGFSGIGMGIFYRYGPEQLPLPLDNWAFKLSLSTSFE